MSWAHCGFCTIKKPTDGLLQRSQPFAQYVARCFCFTDVPETVDVKVLYLAHDL